MRSPQHSAFRRCSFIRRSPLRSSNIAAPLISFISASPGLLSGGVVGIAGRIAPGAPRSLATAYWQGLLTDLLNPKLLLFFFSFLPQFVDPARGEPSLQMLVLGLLFQVTGVPTNLAVALAGGSLAALIARHPFWAAVQRWCSSAVLISLGLRLALSDRR